MALNHMRGRQMQRSAIHQAAQGNIGAAVVLSGAARKQHAVGNAKQAAKHAPKSTVVVVTPGTGMHRPRHVVFALDCSGSMEGVRIDAASDNMLHIFQNRLAPNDKISLIQFNDSVRTVFKEKTKAADSHDIVKAFSNKKTGGKTAFWDAMNAALEFLDKTNKGEDQWVIALTDGDDNASKKANSEVVTNLLKFSSSQNVRIVVIALGPMQEEWSLRDLCAASKKGLYIQAAMNDGNPSQAIADAFKTVDELMAVPSGDDNAAGATPTSSTGSTPPAFCVHCGAATPPGMKFCASCGAAVVAPQPPATSTKTTSTSTTYQSYERPPTDKTPLLSSQPPPPKEETSSGGKCCTIL